ncbi:MAG TPA: AraC family transcriptional regulator [Syntrophomonadaceae bacterium]|nr:AraC family transcriptional regulator [Syntrophomonadaceae bacterium]
MGYYYEIIRPEADLPVKAVIHEVNEIAMHWHKYIELIMVLEGTVKIEISKEKHILKAGGLVYINTNEIHSIATMGEPNLVLKVQINPDFYKEMYLSFPNLYLDCNSFLLGDSNEEIKNNIRKHLAQIVWEMNNKELGYRSRLGSTLYQLIGELFAVSPIYINEEMDIIADEDLNRLQRITEYIDMNLDKGVSLKEIAELEHMSYYYLSRFIKEKLNMTFQEYLTQARLNKALSLLYTDKTITEISNEVGFVNLATFNRLFKEEFQVTPSEYIELTRHKHLKKNPNKLKMSLKTSGELKEIDIFPIPTKENGDFDIDRSYALKMLFTYLETK